MDLEMTESVWLYFLSKTIFLVSWNLDTTHTMIRNILQVMARWTGYLLWSKTAKISPNRVTTELFLEEE